MVWLDVTGSNGSALYFVTDRIERQQGRGAAGFTLAGIVGDGQYEGEVIVEVGAVPEVTYIDAWLAARDFSAFERRIDLVQVTAALTAIAERVIGGLGGQASCFGERRAGRSGRVAEASPVWRAVA
ncbi:hypothetical protein [Trichloromonas sp.]|uniref:hypothetical protein n=1 Tax=Trichloromonas sp. TaxID=3069249 RepID=UPI003D81743E